MAPAAIPPAAPEPQPAPPALTVCVLASGSRGNAIYVADATTAVLIDAGLSGVEIERRLLSRGLCPERLTAVLVTHEHDDHIRGVGVLSRRLPPAGLHHGAHLESRRPPTGQPA